MLTKTGTLAIAAILLINPTSAVSVDEPAIPHCGQSYGTLALREPQTQYYWWREYDLANPEALIKLYVNQSGCFTMVDRGEGLEMRQDERGLADSGELQVDSNIGKGQMTAADFFLIPNLVAKDSDASGKGIAGVIGGKVGGELGGLLGGLKTKKLEADSILTLVNARTGVQEVTARGTAEHTDISFGAGGLLGAVAAIGGGYSDTEIGRVISAAFAEAYTQLVAHVQQTRTGLEVSAPTEAYSMAVDSEMYTSPSRGDAVRKMRAGTAVYPTGKREGAFLEVKDKFGTTGWVSVEDLE
ncbi:MAG: peptidoglycan-binding protein [Gammaproteobacteria bacterium]|nr:peptidoglycan-binding protein [Gammaproteobacteria bacterium]